jgi:hypothetical protein
MIDQVVRINTDLFGELRGIWERGKHPIPAILERLRREIAIEQQSLEQESLLLYGRIQDNVIVEQAIGSLIAVAPGVVVLNADSDLHLRPLSGLLERVDPHSPALFGLRPFSPPHLSVILCIWPSTFPKERRFTTCPVWIDWGIGAGQGESDGTLGIDPFRWRVMEPWLDKWLPES